MTYAPTQKHIPGVQAELNMANKWSKEVIADIKNKAAS